MRRLEDAVAPILSPLIRDPNLKTSVPVADLATIATWATKSAMVLERASPEARHIYTRDEHQRLMDTLLPSASVAVWLARYDGPQRLHSTLKNPRDVRTDARVQTATVAIDSLIVQVTTGQWPTDRPFVVHSGDQKRWEGYLLQVWPLPTKDLQWPPAQTVTAADLKDFTDRFATGIFLRTPKPDTQPQNA